MAKMDDNSCILLTLKNQSHQQAHINPLHGSHDCESFNEKL